MDPCWPSNPRDGVVCLLCRHAIPLTSPSSPSLPSMARLLLHLSSDHQVSTSQEQVVEASLSQPSWSEVEVAPTTTSSFPCLLCATTFPCVGLGFNPGQFFMHLMAEHFTFHNLNYLLEASRAQARRHNTHHTTQPAQSYSQPRQGGEEEGKPLGTHNSYELPPTIQQIMHNIQQQAIHQAARQTNQQFVASPLTQHLGQSVEKPRGYSGE